MIDAGECITNMMSCRPGEHCLYRDYGLNVVDRAGGLRRADIKAQIEKFYPDVTSVEITNKTTDSDALTGRFVYDVHVKGTYNGGAK